jgi:hypothetical protein
MARPTDPVLPIVHLMGRQMNGTHPRLYPPSIRLKLRDVQEVGFPRLVTLLASRMEKDGSTGVLRPQKRSSEARQVNVDYITDFARELGDEAPLSSSVQRAYNLYQRSGLSIGSFTRLLYEARSTTQEYSANIKKTRSGDSNPFGPRKAKMAYFFSILEKLVPGGEEGENTAASPPG